MGQVPYIRENQSHRSPRTLYGTSCLKSFMKYLWSFSGLVPYITKRHAWEWSHIYLRCKTDGTDPIGEIGISLFLIYENCFNSVNFQDRFEMFFLMSLMDPGGIELGLQRASNVVGSIWPPSPHEIIGAIHAERKRFKGNLKGVSRMFNKYFTSV